MGHGSKTYQAHEGDHKKQQTRSLCWFYRTNYNTHNLIKIAKGAERFQRPSEIKRKETNAAERLGLFFSTYLYRQRDGI